MQKIAARRHLGRRPAEVPAVLLLVEVQAVEAAPEVNLKARGGAGESLAGSERDLRCECRPERHSANMALGGPSREQ